MVDLDDKQKQMVLDLLSGVITQEQFNAKRSNSRRNNNLERSCELAIVYEVYKQEVKNGKTRKEQS